MVDALDEFAIDELLELEVSDSAELTK